VSTILLQRSFFVYQHCSSTSLVSGQLGGSLYLKNDNIRLQGNARPGLTVNVLQEKRVRATQIPGRVQLLQGDPA
jgi:hypothetical protein